MKIFWFCVGMMTFSMIVAWIRFGAPYAILLTASCVIGFLLRGCIGWNGDKDDEEEQQ